METTASIMTKKRKDETMTIVDTIYNLNSNTLGAFHGKNVFIRTVTMFYVGRLASENEKFVFIEDAAWVADTGRFYDFLKNGSVNEVEPYTDAIAINKDAIVEVTIWNHELLKKQK
jgi:hypothetical protein